MEGKSPKLKQSYFFHEPIPSLIKEVGKSKKTKPTMVILSSFKTDITKVGLVFLISNFFVNKTVQGRNWFAIFLKKLALKSVKSCLFSSREWYSPHLPVRSVLGQDSLSMPPYQTCPFPAGPPYQVVFIYSGKS